MKLVFHANATPELQFTVEPSKANHNAAVDAIRKWSNLEQLVQFANARHGYGNIDAYFGVTYPEDDRGRGEFIPTGFVQAYAWYGAASGESFVLAETEYLDLLKQYLLLMNRPQLAAQVRAMTN